MKFYQEVKIKTSTFENIVKSFHDIRLVQFLTYLQPIKIIHWDGIENNKIAFFLFLYDIIYDANEHKKRIN